MNLKKIMLTEKASHRRIHRRWYLPRHPSPSLLLSAPDSCESSSCAFCFQTFWRQLWAPTGCRKERRKWDNVSVPLAAFPQGCLCPFLHTITCWLWWGPTWLCYWPSWFPTPTPSQMVSAKKSSLNQPVLSVPSVSSWNLMDTYQHSCESLKKSEIIYCSGIHTAGGNCQKRKREINTKFKIVVDSGGRERMHRWGHMGLQRFWYGSGAYAQYWAHEHSF